MDLAHDARVQAFHQREKRDLLGLQPLDELGFNERNDWPGMTQHYGKKHPVLYAQIMKKHTTPANAKANVSAAIGELIVVYCLLVL